MHRCSEIHEAMTSLTNLDHVTSNQHVEMGSSRKKRDVQDLIKLVQYFTTFNPFSNISNELRSISSGAICKENSNVKMLVEDVGIKMPR